MKVAVVGGGWAGLAAAVAATRASHSVTLFEATRLPGGRARSLAVELPDGSTAALDNGQHIMIGAYVQTLQLMQQVGVVPQQVLHALPLTLRFPDGGGLALPRWSAPWDAAWGIAMARGWRWRDKASLLRTAARWRLARFECPPDLSVEQLCRGLSERVMAELVAPLCVSALNTPPQRSSGQVFLRVLRDALFGRGHGKWGGSNLLLPLRDLGQLFPQAAVQWLARSGSQVVMGHRVEAIAAGAASAWQVDAQPFDAVILACPPWESARLVRHSGAGASAWAECAAALEHEAIATVYATSSRKLACPVLALRTGPGAPAQFVFDRGQLGGPAGLLAFVVSASEGDRDSLQRQVVAQAHALGWDEVKAVQTIVEKRATFACTPGMRRPPIAIAPGLLACGDYVEGPYPATLEGAVRAALAAVALLG
jgi:squalene-associated FAD-dependent desaturase